MSERLVNEECKNWGGARFTPSSKVASCSDLIDVMSFKRCVLVVCSDSSQDKAMIDLLAGLQDDGFRRTPVGQSSQSQTLPGARSYNYNSDEEEAEPELDKEEAELSMIMSQRWDSEPSEHSAVTRQALPYSLLSILVYAPGFILDSLVFGCVLLLQWGPDVANEADDGGPQCAVWLCCV